MSGFKYYERINYIIELIEKKRTGTPSELAGKFNISERMIYKIINSIKYSEHRNIVYSKQARSYLFEEKIGD
jgi:predicted DNA-binding transcriptional regulator YafY